MNLRYLLNVKYNLKPDKALEFVNRLEKMHMEERCLKDDGCILYQYSDLKDNVLELREIWTDREHQQKHLKTGHIAELNSIKDEYVLSMTVDEHTVYVPDEILDDKRMVNQNGSNPNSSNSSSHCSGNNSNNSSGNRDLIPINATVTVPGSKSMTNRALLMAALSDKEVTLQGVLFSDDSRHFLSSLERLGFALNINENEKTVKMIGTGGNIPHKTGTINVGSAGTAARFLTAMLALSDGEYTINCSQQMERRPMKPLFDVLESMGAEFTYLKNEGFLPVKVKGNRKNSLCTSDTDKQESDVCTSSTGIQESNICINSIGSQESDVCTNSIGNQESNICTNSIGNQESNICTNNTDNKKSTIIINMDISKSTQFLSAMLMVAPVMKYDLNINITSEKKTGAYIHITMEMLKDFGVNIDFDGSIYRIKGSQSINIEKYTIEPDVSAACYFFAAAAITGGSVVVENVFYKSMQGDMQFLEVLKTLGCDVAETQKGIQVTGTKDGIYDGVDVDMNNFSDQALTLAVVAAFAHTKTIIRNVGHIRGQECDRMKAIVNELSRCGIEAMESGDDIIIHPGNVHGAVIETYDDHRVAMAFNLLSLRARGIIIDNPMCCRKTFENYFEVFEKMVSFS